MVWVRERRAGKGLTHYSEAPEPLEWPNLPEKAMKMADEVSNLLRKRIPYVHWERPALDTVDPKRRLLATGRYADEEAALAAGRPRGWLRSGLTRAAAAQKSAGREVVGRKQRVTATKKRKKDGVGAGAGAPDSSVSLPTTRRSL